MLDFTPVRNKEITYADLCRNLSVEDLRDLTDSMIDRQLDLIAGCTNADVVFEPEDPAAKDDAAATEAEVHMAWTLGHVIVHVTASSEEAAFLAAEMARGVEYEPRRSRAEVHWTTVKTIAECRDRLEESRRMRQASLDLWPDQPHLDNTYVSPHSGIEIDPVMRFVFGLSHDDAHLAQLEDVIGQAQSARG
jgi:hypothetical protein